jgi:GNAT superfamily N-acetyltransferase
MIDVRLATLDEARAVHQITPDAFESSREILNPPPGALSETLEEIQALIEKQSVVIALINGQAVGACRMPIYEDHVYCGRLAVTPLMQGKGVGTAILRFLEEEARRRKLPEVRLATREVLTSNMLFYQRLGFVIRYRCQHPRGTDMVVEFSKKV